MSPDVLTLLESAATGPAERVEAITAAQLRAARRDSCSSISAAATYPLGGNTDITRLVWYST